MKKTEKIILSFDLDFTLIDNSEGIFNSFQYASRKYNLPEIDRNELRRFIGTPLDFIFTQFYDIDPKILTIAFREYYSSDGIFQVRLLPGVKDKLNELSEKFKLGVITSKKQEIAKKLLDYLEIANFFDYVIGETEKIKSKTDDELINFLKAQYANFKFIVIGDHPMDKSLAEKLVSPFIGVLTGSFSAKELNPNEDSNILILNSVSEITPEKILSLF
jgi:phosphoglycolate phosphatase